VTSVLFGATSPAQVADDVGALELYERLTEDDLRSLCSAVQPDAAQP
jgi:hypothetical protein